MKNLMNQKSDKPPQKAPRSIDDPDDFDLPIPPPLKPSKNSHLSATADEMSKGRDQTGNDSNPDSNPVVENQPRPKIEIVKVGNTACRLDPEKSKSHENGGSKIDPQDVPLTIDDHPFVAGVIVFLSIFATIVIGWISIELPVFLIGLFIIYAIAYDFFRKRRIRTNLRRKHSQQW